AYLNQMHNLDAAALAAVQTYQTTTSARSIADAAGRVAARVGAAQVETRHIFGAYLLEPNTHDDDFAAWGLDRAACKRRLVQQLPLVQLDDAERCLAAAELADAFSPGVQIFLLRRATTASPPRTIDALTMFDAIVLEGAQYPSADFISTWLFHRVGDAR